MTTMTQPMTQPRMRDQAGIRFGMVNGALVTVLLLAGTAGLNRTLTGLVAVGVAGLASYGLPTLTTVASGVVSWAMFTGFFENRYGQLTLAPSDLVRLVVFVVATLVVFVVATLAIRHVLRPDPTPDRIDRTAD